MTQYLTQNAKMRKSGGQKYAIFNWGIPAIKTCPWAGSCKAGCYATQQTYTWPVVAAAYEWRFQQALRDHFVDVMSAEITKISKRKAVRDKQLVIRIHDSGDFFNMRYMNKWLEIMARHPDVIFYAYTKSIAMHQSLDAAGRLPNNYRWIQSEGGIQDALIDYGKPHARVFGSEAELNMAGYENAMDNDAIAFTTLTGRVGLWYHGADAKKWETSNVG